MLKVTKELQALALDIRVLNENKEEIEIRELDDEDDDLGDSIPAGREPLPDTDYDDAPALDENDSLELDEDITLDDDFADFEADDMLDDLKLDDDDDLE